MEHFPPSPNVNWGTKDPSTNWVLKGLKYSMPQIRLKHKTFSNTVRRKLD